MDPLGNVVILRQGRSDAAGPGAFGRLHAAADHNLDDTAIERTVSSSEPLTAPHGRKRYIANHRAEGHGDMTVWVEVDPRASKDAPDKEPFGVVTAYCKIPSNGNPENCCPDWVNDTT